MEVVRMGKHCRAVDLPPEVNEKLGRLGEGGPFGAFQGADGEHALAWALSIAALAGHLDLAPSDLVRAVRILATEVERGAAAKDRTRSGRRLDPALRNEVFAAFEAGRSRRSVQREHRARCDGRRPPWASRDAIADLYREWKRRPTRVLRGRGSSR